MGLLYFFNQPENEIFTAIKVAFFATCHYLCFPEKPAIHGRLIKIFQATVPFLCSLKKPE